MDEAGSGRPAAEVVSGRARKKKPARRRASGVVRRVAKGDVPPRLGAAAIAEYSISESVSAANESKAHAVRDILSHAAKDDGKGMAESFESILAGAAPDDVLAIRNLLMRHEEEAMHHRRQKSDTELADDWREGGYPYRNLMSRKTYEQHKYRLQVELLKLQAWVKETGARVVILF